MTEKAIAGDIGIAILAAGTGLALTSALNPSPGTLRELVLRKGDIESAQNYRIGVNATIVVGAISSAAMWAVFPGRTGRIASVAMAMTTVGLGLYYYYLLSQKEQEITDIGKNVLRRWF